MSIKSVIDSASAIIRGTRLALDIYEDISGLSSNNNSSDIYIASTVYKVTLISYRIFQAIAGKNASAETLTKLKTGELVISWFGLPVDLIRTVAEEERIPENQQSLLRVVERGILAPLLTIARTDYERVALLEQKYIKMYEEDHSAIRPVYGIDRDGCSQIIGSEVIDPKKCQNNIKEIEGILPFVSTAESICYLKTTSKLYSVVSVQLMRLSRMYRQNPYLQFPAPVVQGIQNQVAQSNDQNDPLDLLQARRIPDALENDPVFNLYICPITQCPIRYPVLDPTTKDAQNPTYYEYEAKLAHVRIKELSPTTRQPFSERQVVVDKNVQKIIETRLALHQRSLDQFLRNMVNSSSSNSSSSTVSSVYSASSSTLYSASTTTTQSNTVPSFSSTSSLSISSASSDSASSSVYPSSIATQTSTSTTTTQSNTVPSFFHKEESL